MDSFSLCLFLLVFVLLENRRKRDNESMEVSKINKPAAALHRAGANVWITLCYSLWMSCSHTCRAMARTAAWDCTSPWSTNTALSRVSSHRRDTNAQTSGRQIGGRLFCGWLNEHTRPLNLPTHCCFILTLAVSIKERLRLWEQNTEDL